MKKVAIVGYGYVGKAMHKIFPDALIYDVRFIKHDTSLEGEKGWTELDIEAIQKDGLEATVGGFGVTDKAGINACDLALVCVPTPIGDGGKCDTSLVEEVMTWLKTHLVLIKSTIPPGTTKMLQERTGNPNICFSPEYVGEGKYFVPEWKYANPTNPLSHGFFIVGGDKKVASSIVDIFKRRMGPDAFYAITDERTAELCKYFENAWGALKVSFCNQMFDLAEKLGVNYNELRELWLLDKRVERMHTAVFPDARGWGGKCYPKDISAIIEVAREAGAPITTLEAAAFYNKKLRGE